MVEIRRMGPQIGVEVRGVDVRTLDDQGFAPIYQAWLDCNILCVRDQELTIPEFILYSRRFGPVVPPPRNRRGTPNTPRSRCSGSTNSTPTAGSGTKSIAAAPRAGTPTAPTMRRRSRRPSLCASGPEPRRQHALRQRLCRL